MSHHRATESEGEAGALRLENLDVKCITNDFAEQQGEGNDETGFESHEPQSPATILPMPTEQDLPPDRQPGAVAMPAMFGENGSRLVRGQLTYCFELEEGQHINTQAENCNANQGLVEATPLPDGASREFQGHQQATEVPVGELKESPNQKKEERQYKNLVCLVVAISILILVLGLGLGLGLQQTNSIPAAGLPKTVPSTFAPSGFPSFAPTGALDMLMSNLPNYTLESLNIFGTPQWMAWDWLERHPDLPFMEEWQKLQLFALTTFFYSFDGPNWREEIRNEWLLYSKSECLWFSTKFGEVTDDGYQEFHSSNEPDPCNQDGEFVTLHLSLLGLPQGHKASIPPEIELLSKLEVISINKNSVNESLSDWLPSQIYNMSSLSFLALYGNGLKGILPTQLFGLTNLQFLGLWDNDLTGSIPEQIAQLSKIVALSLWGNSLTGSIPNEIGFLSNLDYLGLWSNSLSGTIPSQLFSLQNMTTCFLDFNALTGDIPTQIGILPSLQRVGFHFNQLSGPLPSQLGLLSSLGQFSTVMNPLSGVIPTQVGMMAWIQALDLSYSSLTGPIPSQVGLLTALAGLSLEGNALTGSVPNELTQLSGLNALALGSNTVTGTISTNFGRIPFLQGLYIGGSLLSGNIPSQFGLLSHLGVLDLSNMPLLTGSIPVEMTNLTFHILKLGGSPNLSGTVPSQYCEIGTPCTLDYWWLEYRMDTKECALEFDCTNQLCGCDCPCA